MLQKKVSEVRRWAILQAMVSEGDLKKNNYSLKDVIMMTGKFVSISFFVDVLYYY